MNDYCYYITPKEYEIAKKNGICAHTLEYRVRDAGWNIKDAITKPIKGKEYKMYYAIAESNGISKSTFRKRISSYNMDLITAATNPLDKKHQAARNYPKEVIDTANRNGISTRTFYSRMRLKWSLDDAITVKPGKRINKSFNHRYKKTIKGGVANGSK